jgi:cytoskeleton protein RodZ
MQTLGQKFQAAREAKGLSIEEVAERTRINPAYLRAIEAEDQSRFPGAFFYRSFTRQYAEMLELPENSYVPELERSMSDQAQTLAALPSQIPDKAIQVPPMPGVGQQSPEDTRRWLLRIAGLALVLLGCSAIYTLWQKGALNALFSSAPAQKSEGKEEPVKSAPPPAPVETPRTEPQQTATGAPPESAGTPPAGTQPEGATPAPGAQTPPASPPTPPAAPIDPTETRIRITATELVWVDLAAGGKMVFSDSMKAGDTREFTSKEPLRLRLGNAGGVVVEHQGRPIPTPGQRGQVLSITFTPSGVYPQGAVPPELQNPAPKKLD